jgi:multidrug efflux pump subunit AcrB
MIAFFLRRPVITNLLTLFILVVGFYQFVHTRRESFPDVDFDIVTIDTVYPGASPEDVECLVTRKIEDQIRTVGGLDKVQSYSIENRSTIVVTMDDDLSARQIDRAVDDLQQAVNRVSDLPEAADRPVVEELTSDRPLITLSVAGGGDDVRRRLADELTDALEDIPGVSRVDKSGYLKREIRVELDRRRLNRAVLSPGEVADAVFRRNVETTAGAVDVGDREVWARVSGGIRTARDVEDIVLRVGDDRRSLRVGDLGRVRETLEEPRVRVKAGGLPAIDLNVRKLRRGDTIELADAVRRLRDAHAERAKALGVQLIVSDDWSYFIRRRLNVMKNNLVQGGFLVLAALFVFLDWRLAAVAVLGVPISFGAVFVAAPFFGLTLNLMSLLAFIIVLGMLDDDSVVVAENIYRHLEMGKPPFTAAVEGAREVAVPVLASVAASCCAFLPFALVTGIMGKFLFMIPVVVVLAFAASAFEAFFILPGHVVEIMPLGRPVEGKESRWFRTVTGGFRRAVAWTVTHRAQFLLLLVAVLTGTVVLATLRLKFVLFPGGLVDQFFVQMDMPEGSSLDATERSFQSVEDRLRALPAVELEAVRSTIGLKGIEEEVRLGTHYAQARVFLTPEETRVRKTRSIIDDLRRDLEGRTGAGRITFEELRTGPPVGRAVQVRVRGRDVDAVGRLADRLVGILRGMSGVTDIVDAREGGKEERRLVLDPHASSFAGVSVAAAARQLLFTVDGGEATVIRRPDENDEIRVRVRLQEDQRSRAEDWLGVDVPNAQGRSVRLGRVARIDHRRGAPYLERFNFRPCVNLTADVDGARLTSREANRTIQKAFASAAADFPGVELVYGGEEEQTQKSLSSLWRAFLVALFLDFVILAAVFRSYFQPFLILLTIPIGLLGVIYALLIHGHPVSFMALLGVVAMTGVVVNNGIVLVNFINQKRTEGLSVVDAAVEGAVVRLRPIWASSLTTLLGLFPSAYGWGGHEPFVAPMALALAWGLTIAMPMTLFLMPTAYVAADDLSQRFQRLIGWARTRVSRSPRR